MQSIAWVEQLGIWIMMYDSRPDASAPPGAPTTPGLRFCHAKHPWGPWTMVGDAIYTKDQGYTTFIHAPPSMGDDGLDGPFIGAPGAAGGGAFSPMIIEAFTTYVYDPMLRTGYLCVYYTMSTSIPYYVVLMRSSFQVKR